MLPDAEGDPSQLVIVPDVPAGAGWATICVKQVGPARAGLVLHLTHLLYSNLPARPRQLIAAIAEGRPALIGGSRPPSDSAGAATQFAELLTLRPCQFQASVNACWGVLPATAART